MSLHAVPAIFAKKTEREKSVPTTFFDTKFMSNVPADSKVDPAISLVGNAGRQLTLGLVPL
jgi:hypothetical protein